MGQSFLYICTVTFFFNFAKAEVLDLQLRQPSETAKIASRLPYVDTMIVVAVDVSGSVDHNEYQIQKDGIINAFSDPDVQNLLSQCSTQGIGITYVEWSGYSKGYDSANHPFVQVIPWTRLTTKQHMNDFANALLSSPRSSNGETDIARALEFSRSLFNNAPFESDNRIVSLSTDGIQGFTLPGISAEDFLKAERDKLALAGVTINAIGIEAPQDLLGGGPGGYVSPSEDTISNYLHQNVRSGDRSFVESATNFKVYSDAFKKQLYVMMNACIS